MPIYMHRHTYIRTYIYIYTKYLFTLKNPRNRMRPSIVSYQQKKPKTNKTGPNGGGSLQNIPNVSLEDVGGLRTHIIAPVPNIFCGFATGQDTDTKYRHHFSDRH